MIKIFAIIIISFNLNLSFGCSCISIDTFSIKQEFSNRDIVFSGELIQIDTVIIENHFPNQIIKEIWYTFKVNKKFKGEYSKNTIRIQSGSVNADDCKFIFHFNQEYLVYANHKKNDFQTTNCTNTSIATKEKFLEAQKGKEISINPSE